MHYLALSAVAVLVMLLASVNTFYAFAQVSQLAGPGITMTPTLVKQGDKTLVSIYGFLANSNLNLQIVGYGSFSNIVTDATGHAVIPLTVPNMLSGTYTLQVSDNGGHSAQTSFTVNPTANTPTPTYSGVIFSHYIIPQYTLQNPTTRTNLVLEAKNIFIVPASISISYGFISGGSVTGGILVTNILLQPGQSYVFTGSAFTPPSSVGTIAYILKASVGSGYVVNDEIKVLQYASYPTNGDNPTYPETFDTLSTLGNYTPYPVPPSSSICPAGYHIDLNTGHCLNNITGSCLDCGNSIASIQLTERQGLNTGVATQTAFNFVAIAKDKNSAPVQGAGMIYLFANGQKISNATADATTGSVTFPVIFQNAGSYTVEAANNTNDSSPVKSSPLMVAITTQSGGGGSGTTFVDLNALILGLPLWLWIVIILAVIIGIVALSRRKGSKRMKVRVRRK